MASITVASGSGFRLLTLGALVLLLNVKARWEETRLTQRFEGYADYAALTPRFVPFRLQRSQWEEVPARPNPQGPQRCQIRPAWVAVTVLRVTTVQNPTNARYRSTATPSRTGACQVRARVMVATV